MRALKVVFDFYINSSIHVALAVFSLTWITLMQFNLDYDQSLLYFVFFASITGYNFVKFFGVAKFHHRKLTNKLKIIQIFSAICFVLMSFFFVQLSSSTLLVIALFGVITFLYAVPILPRRYFVDQQNNLRSIGGLKIYLIALVWTGVTVILPAVEHELEWSTDFIITAVQRFLIVIVLMLPFEIRDLNYDSLKLSTIPQSIGITGTKILGVGLLIVTVLLEYYREVSNESMKLGLIMITVLLTVFVLLSFKRQNKYYTAFWVEALPIFWVLLLLMIF